MGVIETRRGTVLEILPKADFVDGGEERTRMPGDPGADVIEVESPRGGAVRGAGPPPVEDGRGAIFLTNGRNKRGIVLDLKDSRGLAAMMRLMDGRDEADDLIEDGVTFDGSGGDWARRAEPHERGDLAVIIAPSERLATPRASKLASSSQS